MDQRYLQILGLDSYVRFLAGENVSIDQLKGEVEVYRSLDMKAECLILDSEIKRLEALVSGKDKF